MREGGGNHTPTVVLTNFLLGALDAEGSIIKGISDYQGKMKIGLCTCVFHCF